MRKILTIFLALALGGASVFVSSCSRECYPGYEGTDCKTESRAKFLGTWAASPAIQCSSYPLIDTLTIATSSSIYHISINNLAILGSLYYITAIVDSANTYIATIPLQSPADSLNLSLSGTMTLSGNILTVSYTLVPIGGTPISCSGTFIQ